MDAIVELIQEGSLFGPWDTQRPEVNTSSPNLYIGTFSNHKHRYLIGLSVSEYQTPSGNMEPATAYLLHDDPGAEIIWLHNDGYDLQSGDSPALSPGRVRTIGHWQGLGTANDEHGPRRMRGWELGRITGIEDFISYRRNYCEARLFGTDYVQAMVDFPQVTVSVLC
jgi:hypothetical protein